MRRDRLILIMLNTGKHIKYNIFEVSPEAYCQVGYRGPYPLSGDASFLLSGFNLLAPHIKKVQSNLKSCSAGEQQGLSNEVKWVRNPDKFDRHRLSGDGRRNLPVKVRFLLVNIRYCCKPIAFTSLLALVVWVDCQSITLRDCMSL